MSNIIEKGYQELQDDQKKDIEIFLRNRMSNENVSFKKNEDVALLLEEWNPKIKLEEDIVKGFSKSSLKTINKIVLDRIISCKTKTNPKETEKYIAKVTGTLNFSLGKRFFIETVLFTDKDKPDNEIKEEALEKISLTGQDYSNYKLEIERKEIVELNTDLLPIQNGRIQDPEGSLLRELKKYILNNRKSLIGNNSVELFYHSSTQKIEIKNCSSPSLEISLVENLPDNFKKLFHN